MLIVLIRPPSLEPSTPDVREPSEWTKAIGGLGYRLAGLQRRQDGLDGGVVAESPGVQDHVVVRRVGAVVAVDLADVGGPVLLGGLQPLASFLLGGDAQPLHDRLDPDGLGRPEEDVDRKSTRLNSS